MSTMYIENPSSILIHYAIQFHNTQLINLTNNNVHIDHQKPNNLQYNTVGRYDNGMILLSDDQLFILIDWE